MVLQKPIRPCNVNVELNLKEYLEVLNRFRGSRMGKKEKFLEFRKGSQGMHFLKKASETSKEEMFALDFKFKTDLLDLASNGF